MIPTNRTMIRKENQDLVYRTEEEKFRNAAKEIKEFNATGQPVLVGTISVEKSEQLSGILKKMGVRHEVLNAKNHEREATIVAQAGRKGTVTVSTNMAGRGTDILLGGNAEFMTKDACLKEKVAERLSEDEAQYVADEHFYYFTHHDQFYRVRRDKWDELYAGFKQETDAEHDEVVALGGLHIVATERHESRRIDNQLRGRAGRQGDPGSSRFFLSLQDDLLRIFGGERMQNLMLRLGMEEDVPIESQAHHQAHRQGPGSRRSAEFRGPQTPAGIRRRQQQAAPGGLRHAPPVAGRRRPEGARHGHGARHRRAVHRHALPRRQAPRHLGPGHAAQRHPQPVRHKIDLRRTGQSDASASWAIASSSSCSRSTRRRKTWWAPDVMRQTERIVMLQVIDNQWKDHLLSMDELKQGIGNRAYGQKDPLVEYKKESYELFTAMMDRIEDESVRYLFFLQVNTGTGPVLPFPERGRGRR